MHLELYFTIQYIIYSASLLNRNLIANVTRISRSILRNGCWRMQLIYAEYNKHKSRYWTGKQLLKAWECCEMVTFIIQHSNISLCFGFNLFYPSINFWNTIFSISYYDYSIIAQRIRGYFFKMRQLKISRQMYTLNILFLLNIQLTMYPCHEKLVSFQNFPM